MKNIFGFLIFFLLVACSSNDMVYWCGDHPCTSDKERKAYFKKNMIVEVKNISVLEKNKSEIEKITQQALIDEKKRIKNEKNLAKQARKDEKERIKEEKYLAKQIRKDEKKRIKEEKYLAKQAQKNEKKRIKNKNKLNKNEKSKKTAKIDTDIIKNDITISNFRNLVEKITKENMNKPYPDINNIPN